MDVQQLTQEVTQLHANLCSALADPHRILLLYALVEKPLNVNELTADLKISQPATSRHLKVLRDHGLVKATRIGQNVEYSINDPRIIEALDLLREVLRSRLTYSANLMETDSERLPSVEIAESIHNSR
jgi:DNA-binding transcriptional ArsR family regulator